ncbi:Uncharacterized membrane protein [Bryocella elongata]|uniref:Uncharacterized membrane protein n=1 Tax=Bryocella elongata TaxID=863522 RepID=A0A1H6AD84_9BACT|nr:DUF4870 domain-containing protein [Bryocella elongata]SEG46005.1 Uncharacterized membrane protein [Bryocella elongata]
MENETVQATGLSDNAAAALAYITIIPAIVFLLVAPYNTKSFIRFNAFQCLGLAVCWIALSIVLVIPFLGWIVSGIGYIVAFVFWILCIVNASKGTTFKIPVIGDFAAQLAQHS